MRHDRTISILFIQLYSGTSFSAEIICKTIHHVMQSSFRKNGVISSCKVQKYRHSLTWLQRRFRVNRFCSRSHARSNFPFCFFHIYFAFQFKLWKTLNESHYHVLIRGKTIYYVCHLALLLFRNVEWIANVKWRESHRIELQVPLQKVRLEVHQCESPFSMPQPTSHRFTF